MMKRIVSLVLFFVLGFVVTTEAAVVNSVKNIGIVIVGSEDFQSEKYFNAARDIVKPLNDGMSIEVGELMQSKYRKYCEEKGISSATPELSDLTAFAEQNDFDRVLCLVVEKPTQDEFNRWDGSFVVRISLQVNAYLCNKTELIKTHSTGKKKESEFNLLLRSPEVRARIGAFKLCANDIGKAMKGLW